MLWFCYKLKQYREEHHLTQKQMAEQCHLSESTIARLENPKNKRKYPSRQTLNNLSKYLKLEELDPLKNMIETGPFVIGIIKIAEKVEKTERRLRAKNCRKLSPKDESTK